MARVKVTLVKSPIGYAGDQRVTLQHLGLRKLWHSVEHADTPAIRGMIHKVRHLVRVDEIQKEARHEAE